MKGNICNCLKIDREEFESKKMRFEYHLHTKRGRGGWRDFDKSVPFGCHENSGLMFETARSIMFGAILLAHKLYKHPEITLWLVDGDNVRLIDAQQ